MAYNTSHTGSESPRSQDRRLRGFQDGTQQKRFTRQTAEEIRWFELFKKQDQDDASSTVHVRDLIQFHQIGSYIEPELHVPCREALQAVV